MKYHKYTQTKLAAGASLLLAAIFIIACNSSQPPPSTNIAAATIAPTHTSTLIPASATPSVTHTLTPPPPTNTPTPKPSSTPTRIPATATSIPTPSPTPQPTLSSNRPASSAAVQVYETTITIPTYPIKDYLTEQLDPVYNIPVFYFDRAGYEAAAPPPAPVDYTGIVLENPYLRLTFMPELGGRLYSAVIKATNQEIFYHNPVVKASRYGVLQPYEANWWLATGGMEWTYPTQEHGYRFGVPWEYSLDQGPDGATITLSDTGPDRVGLSVEVRLPANRATFTVSPKLINHSPKDAPVQLWVNAALALTSGSMSPNTQFIIPTEVITVHSRGEAGWTVPGEKEQSPWPVVGETDLRDYSQWANYLGFFVPNQVVPFIGAYNSATNLGIARLAPQTSPGSHKLFAFGTAFSDRSYTDDDSQYFEIWGGANAGFWPEDDIPLPVDQSLGWQESWWPLAGLGGLTWVNDRVAIYLNQTGQTYILSALVSQPVQGKLTVSTGDTPLLTETFSGTPAMPLRWEFTGADEPVTLLFTDDQGLKLLEYTITND